VHPAELREGLFPPAGVETVLRRRAQHTLALIEPLDRANWERLRRACALDPRDKQYTEPIGRPAVMSLGSLHACRRQATCDGATQSTQAGSILAAQALTALLLASPSTGKAIWRSGSCEIYQASLIMTPLVVPCAPVHQGVMHIASYSHSFKAAPQVVLWCAVSSGLHPACLGWGGMRRCRGCSIAAHASSFCMSEALIALSPRQRSHWVVLVEITLYM
jgi:hypothetical protein